VEAVVICRKPRRLGCEPRADEREKFRGRRGIWRSDRQPRALSQPEWRRLVFGAGSCKR